MDLAGFDLVILDLMLPGTYGMDLLKRYRERRDIPVLILSAVMTRTIRFARSPWGPTITNRFGPKS